MSSNASHFSLQVEKEIAKRYHKEGSAKLATEYNCCVQTILNIVKRNGNKVSRKLLTVEDKNQILSVYEQTKSAIQVNKQLGYSKTSIYRVLDAAGIPRNGNDDGINKRKFSREVELEIVKKYVDEEKGLNALSNEYNSLVATIRNILLRHDIKLRPVGAMERDYPKEVIDTILSLYDKDESISKISRIVKMNHRTVNRLLVHNGKIIVKKNMCGENHGLWKGGAGTLVSTYPDE